MTDDEIAIAQQKVHIKNFSSGRLRVIAEGLHEVTPRKAAASELLQEREQAHDDGILEKHHLAVLAQNERHHAEDLEQERALFSKSNRVAWFAASISIIAALAAAESAWYARAQTIVLPPAQTQQQPMPQQTPTQVSLSASPSVAPSQSPTILRADGTPTKTTSSQQQKQP